MCHDNEDDAGSCQHPMGKPEAQLVARQIEEASACRCLKGLDPRKQNIDRDQQYSNPERHDANRSRFLLNVGRVGCHLTKNELNVLEKAWVLEAISAPSPLGGTGCNIGFCVLFDTGQTAGSLSVLGDYDAAILRAKQTPAKDCRIMVRA